MNNALCQRVHGRLHVSHDQRATVELEVILVRNLFAVSQQFGAALHFPFDQPAIQAGLQFRELLLFKAGVAAATFIARHRLKAEPEHDVSAVKLLLFDELGIVVRHRQHVGRHAFPQQADQFTVFVVMLAECRQELRRLLLVTE